MASHIHEKIDFTASVYIVHGNKVLLIKHKKLGIWVPPGGHIELDEDPNETALREAKEETGLDVKLIGEAVSYGTHFKARDLIPPRFLNRHFFDVASGHEHIDMCYLARPLSDLSEARHEIDGGEMHWFTEQELEENDFGIVPDVRAHARTALKELAE